MATHELPWIGFALYLPFGASKAKSLPRTHRTAPERHGIMGQKRAKDSRRRKGADDSSASRGVPPARNEQARGGSAAQRTVKLSRADDPGKVRQRPCEDIVHRIQWDPSVDSSDFIVGYEDRFLGVMQRPFDAFTWADLSTLSQTVTAIPRHRVVYFMYRGRIVWDKRNRTDDVYGSTGGLTIEAVVAEVQAAEAQQAEEDAAAAEKEEAAAAAGSHRPRKSKKGREDIGDEASASEDSPESASGGLEGVFDHSDRPNFFLCFRCDSPKIRDVADAVQRHAISVDPNLTDSCTPLTALHITLITFRLESEEEVAKATAVLNSDHCRWVVHYYWRQSRALHVEGVGIFRDRVVHATVRKGQVPDLCQMQAELVKAFTDAGVRVVSGHDGKYTPHMTLMKLNRELCRRIHHIDASAYAKFSQAVFGPQRIEKLELARMTQEKADDLFYVVVGSVANVPPTSSVGEVVDLVREITQHGTPAEATRRVTVILRGLPGSGKSHVTRMLQAALGEREVGLCSADHYFGRGVGGEGYREKFDTKKLVLAHQHCHAECTEAMREGKPVVVIDNTNSRVDEYTFYTDAAREAGYETIVVEMLCPNYATMEAFHGRNQHSVPLDACKRMWGRWEPAYASFYIKPSVTIATSQASTPAPKKVPSRKRGKVLFRTPVPTAGPSAADGVFYVAAFLSQESRKQLLKAIPARHARLIAHHCTLAFDPDIATVASTPIGNKVKITVLREVSDAKGHCVSVRMTLADGSPLLSSNAHAHITLSLAEGIEAVYSNSLLAVDKGVPIAELLELDATIGVCSHPKGSIILDRTLALQAVAKPSLAAREAAKVTSINVFDFDGTLFNTPGPVEGKQALWSECARSWDQPGWVTHPESLERPMVIEPGPVLQLYRRFQGLPGSLTVILTGRIEALRPQVERVLEDFGLAADHVLMKAGRKDRTADAKIDSLKQLVRQYPDTTEIRLWDDLKANLTKFRQFKVECEAVGGPTIQVADVNKFASGRSCKSEMEEWLHCSGFLAARNHQNLAAVGLDLLYSAYTTVLAQLAGSEFRLPHSAASPRGMAVCRVFGSFPLGRSGDVDVCFVAPAMTGTNVRWWLAAVQKELAEKGVAFTYLSGPGRCPRLKVRVEFHGAAATDFDVVVCLLSRGDFASLVDGEDAPREAAGVVHQAVDEPSRIAAEGPLFLERTLAALAKLGLSRTNFGLLLEAAKTIQRLLHCSGNEFHCLRTFHLVSLLLRSLEAFQAAGTPCTSDAANLDKLLAACMEWIAANLSREFAAKPSWTSSVPAEHLAILHERLRSALRGSAASGKLGYHELGKLVRDRPQTPSEDCLSVTIQHTCDVSPVVQWQVATFVRGRLGTYVRRMIDVGIDVLPNSDTSDRTDKLRFTVRWHDAAVASGDLEATTRTVLLGLWRELDAYRAQGARVRVVVHHSVATPTAQGHTADNRDKADAATSLEGCDLFLDAPGAHLSFDEWVDKQIDVFVADPTAGPHLAFEPTLTPGERSIVHNMAGNRGLPHHSVGKGEKRHVVVCRTDKLM